MVADALSRFPIKSDETNETTNLMDAFDMTLDHDWRKYTQPLTIAEIVREQVKDKYIQKLQRQSPDKLGRLFEDIGKKSGPDQVVTEISAIDHKQ